MLRFPQPDGKRAGCGISHKRAWCRRRGMPHRRLRVARLGGAPSLILSNRSGCIALESSRVPN
jgi:hypothetical protein